MNVIIIEDEKLSAEHLSRLLGKIDSSIKVIDTFDTVKRSVAELNNGVKAELLFVDVHLADGLSFEIFTKIANDTPIIFTTAYDEYAIKAFKLNSVDYLLKPIGINDLKAAIEKFKKFSKNNKDQTFENVSNAYQQIQKQYKNRFMVKMGDTIASIKTEDICHFVSEDGLVLLVNQAGKRYPVDYNLDQIELFVPPESFFRINRKAIVNINSIQKVSSYFNSRLKVLVAQLDDEAGIVSRERVNEFKSWLDR